MCMWRARDRKNGVSRELSEQDVTNLPEKVKPTSKVKCVATGI